MKDSHHPRSAAVPYLAVAGAGDAIAWYGAVFGAVIEGDPYVNDDGSIGHVALRVGHGVIYLADEAPSYGAVAPTGPGAAVSLMLPVADVEATLSAAVKAGADPDDRGVYEGYGGRNAWFVDPFGHRWGISSTMTA